jgi:hypothetical protein
MFLNSGTQSTLQISSVVDYLQSWLEAVLIERSLRELLKRLNWPQRWNCYDQYLRISSA